MATFSVEKTLIYDLKDKKTHISRVQNLTLKLDANDTYGRVEFEQVVLEPFVKIIVMKAVLAGVFIDGNENICLYLDGIEQTGEKPLEGYSSYFSYTLNDYIHNCIPSASDISELGHCASIWGFRRLIGELPGARLTTLNCSTLVKNAVFGGLAHV